MSLQAAKVESGGLRLGETRARLRGLTARIVWSYCVRFGPPCALRPSMALRAFAQFPKLTKFPEFPEFPRRRAFRAETGRWFWDSGRRGGRIWGDAIASKPGAISGANSLGRLVFWARAHKLPLPPATAACRPLFD